jgi:hypothetical protein
MRKHLRKRPSPAMGVALIALFITLGGTTYAATGGNFILGNANTAGNTSALSSGVTTGPSLSVTNTGGKSAARFTANAGIAPFSVSNATKIGSLNADLLDGVDSAGFLRTSGKAADSNLLDGIDSSGFLRTTGKAADADKLDGLDSNAYGEQIRTGPLQFADGGNGGCAGGANVWHECSQIAVNVPAGKTYRALIFANGSLYEFAAPENRVFFCASARLDTAPGANCAGKERGLLLKADDMAQASAVDVRDLGPGTWILSTAINASDQLDFRNGFDFGKVQTSALITDLSAPTP